MGVVFTITTGRRVRYFTRAWRSLREHWLDRSVVSHWLCGDDGSDGESLAVMRRVAPELKIFAWGDVGHAESLRRLFDEVDRLGDVRYLVHWEDDWKLLRPIHLVAVADAILRSGPASQLALAGPLAGAAYDVLPAPTGSEPYSLLRPRPTFEGWPPFTLNPSVLSWPLLRRCLPYLSGSDSLLHEYSFALKVEQAGGRLACLSKATAWHFGSKTAYRRHSDLTR